MAAEDYFDPYDTRERDRVALVRRPAIRRKSDRNRDIEWTTGQGEILRLEEMEDSHLLNTIAYIGRKMEEYGRTAALAAQLDRRVPAFQINKKPGEFWLEAMTKELDRRVRHEEKHVA